MKIHKMSNNSNTWHKTILEQEIKFVSYVLNEESLKIEHITTDLTASVCPFLNRGI